MSKLAVSIPRIFKRLLTVSQAIGHFSKSKIRELWSKGKRILLLALGLGCLAFFPLVIDFHLGPYWPEGTVLITRLSPKALSSYKVLEPPNFFGPIEIAEWITVIAYLLVMQQEVLRLLCGVFLLTMATMGFLLEAFAGALRWSPLYAEVTNSLHLYAAFCNIVAVAAATIGNWIVRRPRAVYLPATVLLISGSVGILLTRVPFLPDPRYFVFGLGPWSSRRFSACELFYLLGFLWTSWLYFQGRLVASIDFFFEDSLHLLRKQYSIVREYYESVCVDGLQYVNLTWEKRLIGSGLSIRREGGEYHGVPVLSEIRWRIYRVRQTKVWLRHLGEGILIILFGLSAVLIFIH